MNAKDFKDEILNHYLDQDLQVTIKRDPEKWTTGNGLLHTATFYTILAINGLIDSEDVKRFSKCVDLCWESTLENPIIGILERNDGRQDKQAQDDYHVVTASYLLGTYHAEAIANYGETHCWSFNNVDPHKFSFSTWHGRFPGRIGYYLLAAKRDPGWINEFAIKKTLQFGPSDSHSGNIMQWLRVQVIKKQSPKLIGVVKDWEQRAEKKFKSLGDLFAPYYGSAHPMAKLKSINGII